MPSLLEILDDPNYVNANEETKQAIFNKYSATDDNFVKANPATQEAIRVKFGVAVPSGEEGDSLAAFGHGVLRGALPAAAGIVSGAAGATAGMAAGPVGAVVGGLGAGFAGSAATAAAQEKFLEENPKFAKALGLDVATAAREARVNPYASMSGEIAPNLLAFRPSGAMFRSAKGLEEAAAKKVIAERAAAITNSVINTGVGAGMQVGQEALGEEPIDWNKVGIAALGGALGQKETSLGRGLTTLGELPASAATKAAINALRRPTPEPAPELVSKAPETTAGGVPKSQSVDTEAMMNLIPEAERPAIIPSEIAKPETQITPIPKAEVPKAELSLKDVADQAKVMTPEEFKEFASKGKINTAKTSEKSLDDFLTGKSKFADLGELNWEDPATYDLTDPLEKAGFKIFQDERSGATYVAESEKDLKGILKAESAMEYGHAYGYAPEDIAHFYMKRRGGNLDAAYQEYIKEAKLIADEQAAKMAESVVPESQEVVKPATKETLSEEQITPVSDKFAAEHAELGKTLRESLDQMGLNHVGLSLEDSLQGYVNGKIQPVTGKYLQNMISLSLKGEDIHSSMNHEALHAMKDNGFFTDAEWGILSSKAFDWLKKYNIEKSYGNLSKELKLEEAIAKAFADYKTQTPQVKSIISKAIATLQRVGNVFRGRGFKNHEDIFKSAAENKLAGKRVKPEGEARFEVTEKPVTARNVLNQEVSASFVAPEVTRKTEFIRNFQDRHIDLKRTMESIRKNIKDLSEKWDPYQKLGLFNSKVAERFRSFADKEVDPLVKKMDKLKITNDELHTYLLNRRAESYNNRMNKLNPDIVDENGNVIPYKLKDRASSIHTDDARKYFDDLDPKKKSALENLAKDVDNIIDGTHKVLVESGKETQETINVWKKTDEDYAPFFREMEDNRLSTISRKGIGTKGSASKRAMGSERKVADILNSIIGQREQALENAERMVVGRSLFGLTLKAPNPGIWLPVSPSAIKNPALLARELDEMGLDGKDIVGLMQEKKSRRIVKDPITGAEKVEHQVNPLERYKDNVLPVRMNGEDSYIFFNKNDPLAANMIRSFNNMDTPTVGLVGKEIGKVTQWMAKVNTQWNPVFGALNFMRDFGSAMANLSNTELAGQQAKIAGGVRKAMSTIWHTMRTGDYPDTEFGKLYKEFRESGGQTLYREQLVRRADQESMINEKINKLHSNAAKKMASGFFKGLSDFNDSIENAIRLSAFKAAKEKGLSAEKSAAIAKDLTVNFDRKGALGSQINNYFAFFNASAQGTARMMQTLAGPAGKKIALGGLGIGALQAGMMELAGFGDNDPPEFVKSRNFIIPTPDGKYISIPYPLGLHFLPNIGRIAVETGLHGDFAKHASNMAAIVADSFNPLGGGEVSLQTISPTALDPIVALATNKDPFGRPISKQDRATSPTPGFERSREQSSAVNKTIAEALNYITGGTEDTKGFLSPTADQLDYLVGQVTGGVGREIMKISKTAGAVAKGETEDLASYDIPLAGRFYGDTKSNAANSQHFYDNVTKMAEHEAVIKGMRERKENVAEYLSENPDARLWQQVNNAENQISDINKRQKQMRKLNADEDKIKALNDRKQQIMTRINERINSLKE